MWRGFGTVLLAGEDLARRSVSRMENRLTVAAQWRKRERVLAM